MVIYLTISAYFFSSLLFVDATEILTLLLLMRALPLMMLLLYQPTTVNPPLFMIKLMASLMEPKN